MPAYMISHPNGQREDILIEDPALTLAFAGGWAIFSDDAGPSLAIPADRGAIIQRIDPDLEDASTEG